MIKKLSCYLCIWICFSCIEVFAQSHLERGFPAITNYSPKEYDAFRQNWVIAQDKRGVMYFGNTDGLLEFDGESWRLYTVPNKSAILGMAFGEDGKLYAGAQGDLGYFSSDASGQLTFNSLLNFIPSENRGFSNVSETFVSEEKVYFNAEKYILIWDIEKRAFKIIESESGFHLLFKVNGIIYAREWKKGLKVISNDRLELVSEGEKFAEERIYAMLPFPDEPDKILMATRTMGLLIYDGTHIIPFTTEVDQFFKDNFIYLPGTVLTGGNFLLSTLNGGAIEIDPKGREINRYNQENGMINNSIYFTFQDRSGAIWLATDNGISRIDYATPLSYFDSRSNLSYNIYDIIRHKDTLYVGTSNGVFSLDPETSIFQPLKNSNSQSYALLELENDLLVGTIEGLFKKESDKLIPIRRTISDEYYVNYLIQSNVNPNRVFAAVTSGIWSILKTEEGWIDEGQILKITDQPSSFASDKEGNLWLGTFSAGLFRVKFGKEGNGTKLTENPEVTNFDKNSGLQDGFVFAGQINGHIYAATTDSIYKFIEKENRFIIDSSDHLIAKFFELKANVDRVPFLQDAFGRIWLGNKKQLATGKIQGEQTWNWTTSPIMRISDEAIYNIYVEKNEVAWFASGERLIRYDSVSKHAGSLDFSAIIRKVEMAKDSAIYFGGEIENTNLPKLKFKHNSIKFRYAATSYEGKNTNQFSSFLEGFDEAWSSWSPETVKAYTNLPPGDYTFKLKGLNLLGNESGVTSYSFIILPPWNRTWWAYLFYSLVLFLLGLMIHKFMKNRTIRIEREKSKDRELKQAKEIEKAYSELKATQKQLIQSEKMASLGELTAGIAHEIQNPLNFVNNFSEVSEELVDEMNEELEKGDIEEAKFIGKDLKENLSKINHHGKRAGDIVKGMLQHSRIGSGKKEPTDINTLCDEYVRLAYHGLRAKDKSFNSKFDTSFDKSISKIDIVPQDMGRVILNLINNAFYTVNEKQKVESEKPDSTYEPMVTVSTQQSGDHILISVQDNGNGIPAAIKDKIFQPFFTTKPTGSGTGLGLSLSYDIVKAHGGILEVESPPKTEKGTQNNGSLFTIKLPLKNSNTA